MLLVSFYVQVKVSSYVWFRLFGYTKDIFSCTYEKLHSVLSKLLLVSVLLFTCENDGKQVSFQMTYANMTFLYCDMQGHR